MQGDSSAPIAHDQPRPLTTGAFNRIAWLPANTRVLAAFRGAKDPLRVTISRVLGAEAPACWLAVTEPLGVRYQVARDLGADAANVVDGKFDRDTVERCLVSVFEEVSKRAHFEPLSLRREGPITELSWAPGKRVFVGWTDDGFIVWHEERARVVELLARTTSLRTDATMASLVGRAQSDAHLWYATTLDLTTRAIGVTSRGLIANGWALPEGKDTMRIQGTVLFGSNQDASQAVQIVLRRANESREAPEVRSLWGSLHPELHGDDVAVDLSALTNPSALQAILDNASRKP